MNWFMLTRKWILVIVIFCLLGTITQACHEYEEDQDCDKEKKEEMEVEEEVKTSHESVSGILSSKWFLFLERLIEKYPIIERLIERIFQWFIDNILGINY